MSSEGNGWLPPSGLTATASLPSVSQAQKPNVFRSTRANTSAHCKLTVTKLVIRKNEEALTILTWKDI